MPPENAEIQSKIDTTVPQTARIWKLLARRQGQLRGRPQGGDEILAVMPDLREIARACRAFLVRAVRHLAADAGIRQFLDLGTGLPTANNTHEVAQSVAAESRIVYVDNDPLVLAHARALLTSAPQGVTDYIDADARDTDRVLREAARTLDLRQPVGVIMSGILGHLVDEAEAQSMVDRVMGALVSGSYLVISDGTDVVRSEEHLEAQRIWNESAEPPYKLRKPDQIARFFRGLELVEPGVVSCTRWRPDPPTAEPPAELDNFVGVARKP